jgi:hypothetical protein
MVLDKIRYLKWMLIILGGIAGALSILFQPEQQYQGWQYLPGFTQMKPYTNTSAIILVIFLFIGLFITTQVAYYALKIDSDRVLMAGLDRTESCIAANLHIFGNFGFLIAGGAKAVGWDGMSALVAPLTHIHKFPKMVIIEAHATPDTELDDIPPDMKYDIMQRAGGIFGVKDCSVGFLTQTEGLMHRGFSGENYSAAVTEDDKKYHTTSIFLAGIMAKIKAIHPQYLMYKDDATSMAKKIASIRKMGDAAQGDESRSLLDWIQGTGDEE